MLGRKVRQMVLLVVVVCLFRYFWILFAGEKEGASLFLKEFPTAFDQPSEISLDQGLLWYNLSLTDTECRAAFPGLMREIDEAVARGPFELKQTSINGPLEGRIKDGKLDIINWQPKGYLTQQMIPQRSSALSQLYRAIITSPEPLPETIFSLNIRDDPFHKSWSYAHPHDLTKLEPGDFLMPHFSFWAWPLPFVGSLGRGLAAIGEIEASLPFQSKIPKAIWRGTAWFTDARNQDLRKRLIKYANAKPWADVEALQWETNAEVATNALAIEDFCRYKYVIYTEGVTYSGRLLFQQACRSVLLSPPISWKLHNTHLVKPVFSSTLLGSKPPPEQKLRGWTTEYGPEEANMVFVASDWMDLEATIEWLENHPEIAEGIASRQRETFAKGGHLSPAAETCYWRGLIRGWNQVAQTDGQGWEAKEGIPWEVFSVTEGAT